jgi:hypothetical protein
MTFSTPTAAGVEIAKKVPSVNVLNGPREAERRAF